MVETVINGNDYNIEITINNSYNTGEITGINRTGGLAGRLGAGSSLQLTIDNCYNNGKIMRGGNGCNLGGLIGQIVNTANPCNATICNSWNTADILLATYEGGITGGIVSDIMGGKNVNIINCYNQGNLSDVTASGLVGRIRDTDNSNPVLNIINSYNSGSIEGSTFSAGIIRIQNITAKVDLINTYYSNASASKGVEGNEPIQAPIVKEDSYMREEAFVNELNKNIGDIESEIELKEWIYRKGEYPVLADN